LSSFARAVSFRISSAEARADRVVLFGNSSGESTSAGLPPRCYNITKLDGLSGMAPGMRPEQATAMRRLRSRSKWGSCLALFALALQLVLTCGHVHLDRLTGLSAEKFTVAAADASRIAQITPADPGGRDHRADDRCSICTLSHLASALVLAEPPSLPLPHISGRLPSEPPLAFDFLSPQRALFAARAPPTA
jgi:hypothetical protein